MDTTGPGYFQGPGPFAGPVYPPASSRATVRQDECGLGLQPPSCGVAVHGAHAPGGRLRMGLAPKVCTWYRQRTAKTCGTRQPNSATTTPLRYLICKIIRYSGLLPPLLRVSRGISLTNFTAIFTELRRAASHVQDRAVPLPHAGSGRAASKVDDTLASA